MLVDPVIPNLHLYGNSPDTEGLILVNLSTNTERQEISHRLKSIGLVAIWTCFCRYGLLKPPLPGSYGVCFIRFAGTQDKRQALRHIPQFLIWAHAEARPPVTWVWQAQGEAPFLDLNLIPYVLSIPSMGVELFVGDFPWMEAGVEC